MQRRIRGQPASFNASSACRNDGVRRFSGILDLNQAAADGKEAVVTSGRSTADKGAASGQQAQGGTSETSGFSGVDVAAGLNKS